MVKASKLLTDASKLVDGDRRSSYGTPEQSFKKLSKLWSAYLDVEITAHDACVMMTLLKISRLAYKPNEDSSTDGAAYLCLASEVSKS